LPGERNCGRRTAGIEKLLPNDSQVPSLAGAGAASGFGSKQLGAGVESTGHGLNVFLRASECQADRIPFWQAVRTNDLGPVQDLTAPVSDPHHEFPVFPEANFVPEAAQLEEKISADDPDVGVSEVVPHNSKKV
jgi:hypothetical protein